MAKISWLILLLTLLLMAILLSGCPKKVEIPPEKPPYESPILKVLDAFSSAESLRARASIRINMVRGGEENNFLLNGFILYQRPDKLRILGYHPLGAGLFDALYRNGEFFLLSPLQKRAYVGEVSEFEDMIRKAEMRTTIEKTEGRDIPNRILFAVEKKEIHVEIKLKEVVLNSFLPEDSFQWKVPEGIEVKPLNRLLKEKKAR
ncbi:MAG: hypothetical protein ACPL6D_04445 [Thermodesulfobacteriota bacterium]